jgi:hydrocephalus-inducing protein
VWLDVTAEGFLAAGQDVKLEVSFHPTAVNPDIRVERLQCRLLTPGPVLADGELSSAAAAAGGDTAASGLQLTLTAACAMPDAVAEPVVFRCNVRDSTSKSIVLHNSSSSSWQLRPVVQNDFWSGAELVQVGFPSCTCRGQQYIDCNLHCGTDVIHIAAALHLVDTNIHHKYE